MMMKFPEEKIENSPIPWVSDHIQNYLKTNGDTGHEWRTGIYALLITTIGRKTGRLYRTGLIYGMDRNRFIIVASKGGSPKHPNWYLNLKKNPEVLLQVKSEKFLARAKDAEGADRQRLWKMMAEIFPQYEDYQRRTIRKIPVVILERIEK
jgi:deazaflavin-dependent oxidoreductase (nitroreductase family)